MSHSKRNTSLAFFTSHERGLLKTSWGSQSSRLGRDSFLPFAGCQLCLLPAQDPVTCSGCTVPNNSTDQSTEKGDSTRKRKRQRSQCHMFCRECIIANLLAQKKELKRLENTSAAQRIEADEAEARADEEARARAVQEFEQVQAGLDVKLGTKGSAAGAPTMQRNIVGRSNGKIVIEEEDLNVDKGTEKGTKRKFELDEEELVRIAQEERSNARRRIEEEKESSRALVPSFWLPTSNAPSTMNVSITPAARRTNPICPGSTASTPHPLSLKSLIAVNFSMETVSNKGEVGSASESTGGQKGDQKSRSCPSCNRGLTNASKAVLASPCGHVVCGQCADKFMTPPDDIDPHASHNGEVDSVQCFVCGANVGGVTDDKKHKKKDDGKSKHKSNLRGELLDISSEGTGFAGGGKNVVTREGVAFQC